MNIIWQFHLGVYGCLDCGTWVIYVYHPIDAKRISGVI